MHRKAKACMGKLGLTSLDGVLPPLAWYHVRCCLLSIHTSSHRTPQKNWRRPRGISIVVFGWVKARLLLHDYPGKAMGLELEVFVVLLAFLSPYLDATLVVMRGTL